MTKTTPQQTTNAPAPLRLREDEALPHAGLSERDRPIDVTCTAGGQRLTARTAFTVG